MAASKLQIIIGSTRPTREADRVAPWVIDSARAHPGFDVEVLDLRDWPLPMFGEHAGSIGDFSNGIGGGLRAIEHLAHIAIEAELVPLRTSVVIPQVVEAFDVDGRPINPVTDISLRAALDDLAWWADTLKQARAAGQLEPAAFRIRAAAAALNQVEDETG